MADDLTAVSDIGCPLCKLGNLNFGNLAMMTCPDGTPVGPYNMLSQFFDADGTNNFWLTGVGTRDIDTNTTVIEITTPDFTAFIPAGTAIVSAYIYWNILTSADVTADTIKFDSAGPFTGLLIGWCNDTCWLPFNNGFNVDGGTAPQPIYNRVFRYSLPIAGPGSVALTGGTYRVELPGISTNASVATAGSDSAHYPGCNGSQGVALLIIYEDGTTRKIVVHDGCVLLTNPGHGFGGYDTYPVVINPGFFIKNAVIANACGDTQTEYSDLLRYNGTPFLPVNGFGSYFNPNADGGNVLQSKNLLFTGARAGPNAKESVILADFATPAIANCPNTTQIDITSGVECLDWFLHVYAAEESPCCDDAPDPPGLYNQLNLFRSYIGDADTILTGIGTRDEDMSLFGTVVSSVIPGPVIEAYLYWNVFADNTNVVALADVQFNGAGTVAGTYIGWGDNTCWCACDPGDESNTACTLSAPIKNRVYRLNVGPSGTNQVTGTPGPVAYTVKLPNTVLSPLPLCTECPNIPHYPGCAGTQGVALFVIYGDPGNERHILLYDGCAVVIPNGFTPYSLQTPGTQESYTIPINSTYSTEAMISLAVGDAQDTFLDRLLWNNQQLPPIPNHFTPNTGNLLYIDTLPVKAYAGPCCGKPGNTVTVSTPDDCLSWFIFSYKAKKCCKPENVVQCGQPVVSNNNQHFVSP